MRRTKASMRNHHLQTGHMTQMADLVERISSGPDKAAVYSTDRYAPPAGNSSPFADKLASLPAATDKGKPRPPVFLSRAWGFLN